MADQIVMESPVNGQRTLVGRNAFEKVWSKKDPAWIKVTEDQSQFEAALNGEEVTMTADETATAAEPTRRRSGTPETTPDVVQ